MKKYQESKKGSFWGSKVCFFLLCFLCFFIFLGVFRSLESYKIAKGKYIQAVQENELVNKSKDKIEDSIISFDSPLEKERIIRENYNVSREGEGVIVVVDKNEEVEEKTTFGFIKNLFSKED